MATKLEIPSSAFLIVPVTQDQPTAPTPYGQAPVVVSVVPSRTFWAGFFSSLAAGLTVMGVFYLMTRKQGTPPGGKRGK